MGKIRQINPKFTGYLSVLFFGVSSVDILGVGLSIEWLVLVFKPLILLSLMGLYLHSTQKTDYWYLFALLLAFFGDVLLMLEGSLYFNLGLGSFLLAHLLFIGIIWRRLSTFKVGLLVSSLLPFLVVCIFFMIKMTPYLGDFHIPVLVYGIVISVFGASALYYYRKLKHVQALYVLLGAVIFMISDLTLAVHKFYEANTGLAILVMVTYVAAQYLIYRGFVLKSTT